MTGQTESASEYAGLLRIHDRVGRWGAAFDSEPMQTAKATAAAIRALEAKVRELEEDANDYNEWSERAAGQRERAYQIAEELRADRDRLSEALAVEQRVCKGWQETAEKFRQERDRLDLEAARLAGEVERLMREDDANTRELHDICNALPGVAFMDPPDGGSVSIAEQARRMYAALDQERADNERLRACMDELRQGALHMPMTVDRIDVIECLHAHGMCETDGVPTALLSGRGEGR